ncbi:MAG: AAA family ATPase [Candidatus Methanomethylophilus sp.]|jgi:predicted AAA+ superfamily ATPase|nr:AAA family ATPase [Methanomethylophilus sp.]MCI2075150.1 AAA family ATPase [Methanomethylophilus sp.]MCI2092492.1 AAA family ATPase [Methanomethylophilus sp.]
MNKDCPRPLYTERIRLFIGSSVAKVLIGVRGSGKSSVLKTIQQETGSGAVFFDMGARSNVKFRDPDALYGEIKKRLGDGKEMCLIIDEVQMIHDWEDMIRSLIDEKCCDIYISGSDSKLFSSDTSTYLAGRTVSADVFTLTYSECIEFQRFYGRNEDPDYVMDRFLRVGGSRSSGPRTLTDPLLAASFQA